MRIDTSDPAHFKVVSQCVSRCHSVVLVYRSWLCSTRLFFHWFCGRRTVFHGHFYFLTRTRISIWNISFFVVCWISAHLQPLQSDELYFSKMSRTSNNVTLHFETFKKKSYYCRWHWHGYSAVDVFYNLQHCHILSSGEKSCLLCYKWIG